MQIIMQNLTFSFCAKLMRLLLESGADINSQDDARETCLHYIIKGGNYNEHLITNSMPNVKEKAMECLNVLLERPNLDIDTANARGYTPLHLAAIQKNDLFVDEMIKCYAWNQLLLSIYTCMLRKC